MSAANATVVPPRIKILPDMAPGRDRNRLLTRRGRAANRAMWAAKAKAATRPERAHRERLTPHIAGISIAAAHPITRGDQRWKAILKVLTTDTPNVV